MGSITAILVFISSLLVPTLRKKYGYWMTIVVVQSLAIACLVIMSITEIYVTYEYKITFFANTYNFM